MSTPNPKKFGEKLVEHQALIDVVLIVIVIAIMVTLTVNGEYAKAIKIIRENALKAHLPKVKSGFEANMLDESVNDCPDGICEDGGTFYDLTNG